MMYKGKVKSGLGESYFWMKKAKDIFKRKYNMDVFLGTLNIELEEDIYLSKNNKIKPNEYGGNLDVFLSECKINGYKGYIIRTEKNNTPLGDHPLNIIEVVSDISFRDKYNLKDDDIVDVLILN